MPWKETCPMDERVKFIGMYLEGELSMVELCRQFGVERKTGYKWVHRYEQGGPAGLVDRSRAPHHHPNAVVREIEDAIVTLRGRRPRWGPKKLRVKLGRREPPVSWPAASTIGEILQRHGLVVSRRRKRRTPPYVAPLLSAEQPNDVWCADFKGWFRTGDGSRCDPFTLSDSASRLLLRCQAVLHPDEESVRPVLDAAFREFGLPRAIRTDNGPPFATTTVRGLSRLSVWWIKLGIVPERIEPAKPAQNGRHERLHRTLKQETASPPARTLRLQQRAFDQFREYYNHDRPHEALGQQTPASVYHPSAQEYPRPLLEITYPKRYIIRRVHPQGDLRWRNRQLYLSETLAGEDVGLDQVSDRLWHIYWGSMLLAVLDDATGHLHHPKNQKKMSDKEKKTALNQKVLPMCPV